MERSNIETEIQVNVPPSISMRESCAYRLKRMRTDDLHSTHLMWAPGLYHETTAGKSVPRRIS